MLRIVFLACWFALAGCSLSPTPREGTTRAATSALTLATPYPLVGRELVFGTSPLGLGTGSGLRLAGGSGGRFLATWMEGEDIRFTRLAADGSVLDPYPSDLPFSALNGATSVGFNGASYLIAWSATSSPGADSRVYVAPITADGKVSSPNGNGPLEIASGLSTNGPPVVGFDGTNWLIVWSDSRQGGVFGRHVSPTGSLVDDAPFQISYDNGGFGPGIACNAGNCLVVWMFNSAVFGRRLDGAGLSAEQGAIVAASGTDSLVGVPAVAGNGSDFLVVWTRLASSASRIQGARVLADGSVEDSTPIELDANQTTARAPSVASDGGSYLVAWQEHPQAYELHTARVSTSGAVSSRSNLGPASYDVEVAYSDGNWLAGWSGGTVYEAPLSADGSALASAATALSVSPYKASRPVAAFNGSRWLVVWIDELTGDVRGSRVDGSGNVLEPQGLVIGPGAMATGWFRSEVPAVASDGTGWLVTWRDSTSIRAARVGECGDLLDSGGFVVAADGGTAPGVGFDGNDYLIAYMHANVRAKRVSPGGVVLDSDPLALSQGQLGNGAPAGGPRLAFDGKAWLVVYPASDPPDAQGNPRFYIGARRVTPAGALLDSSELRLSPAGDDPQVAVAFQGGSWLVACSRKDGTAVRVSSDGVVLDTPSLTVAPSYTSGGVVDIAPYGENWFVAWTYSVRGYTGTLVDSNGGVADSALLLGDVGNRLALSAGNRGKLLFAYETPATGVGLVKARILAPDCSGNAPPALCSDGPPDSGGSSCTGSAGTGNAGGGTGGTGASGGTSQGGDANAGAGEGGAPPQGGAPAGGGTDYGGTGGSAAGHGGRYHGGGAPSSAGKSSTAGTAADGPDPGQAGEPSAGGAADASGGANGGGVKTGGTSGGGHGGAKAGASSGASGSPPPDSGAGCGCRVAGRDQRSGLSALLLAAFGAGLARRRIGRARRWS